MLLVLPILAVHVYSTNQKGLTSYEAILASHISNTVCIGDSVKCFWQNPWKSNQFEARLCIAITVQIVVIVMYHS